MLKVQGRLLNNDFLSSSLTGFDAEEAGFQFFWSSVCFGKDDLTGNLSRAVLIGNNVQALRGRGSVRGNCVTERQRQCGCSHRLRFSESHVVCGSVWNEIEFFS